MKIAIAVDHQDNIQPGHFGEATTYKIYEGYGNLWQLVIVLDNTLKKFDEDKHGASGKGKGIVKLLAEEGIQAAVSKQFGKNINIVGKYFVPIITSINSVAEFLEHLDESMCNKIEQKDESEIKPLRIP